LIIAYCLQLYLELSIFSFHLCSIDGPSSGLKKISSVLRWAGHVARLGEVKGEYNFLVGRPEGRRLLGRPRRRWEDNVKMDLREIEFGDVDWIH
jgi:hypothetical protein